MNNEIKLTIPQACTYARVSRRTIYNWMKLGKLTIFRTSGGRVRLLQNELVVKTFAKL